VVTTRRAKSGKLPKNPVTRQSLHEARVVTKIRTIDTILVLGRRGDSQPPS
jgi:hypothetical protein